jgi:formylmethanofuran dehydrogenase subunit C
MDEPMPPILLSNPNSKNTEIGPGRYSNLRLQGDIHLQPGLYYIEGSLTIQGTVTGTGVAFFMKDGGIRTNGNAALSVSAPTSGEHAGMLFWSAPNNTSSHSFNGNGATDLDGVLYFPKGDLTFNGNHGTQSTCLRIVADTVEMSGNSRMRSDCTAELGGREARVAGHLYLSR